jgi:ABC-type hemin transport system substrate-binding protein
MNKLLVTGGFTLDYISEARMMKIALVSLAVPAANVRAVGRREYRRLADLAAASGDKSATVLALGAAKALVATDSMSRWTFVFMD